MSESRFLVLDVSDVFTVPYESELFEDMANIAKGAFAHIESAWAREGVALVDMKVEFGIDSGGMLLLADVIDNDSWRLVRDGNYLDKQTYRVIEGVHAKETEALTNRLWLYLDLPRFEWPVVWCEDEVATATNTTARADHRGFGGPELSTHLANVESRGR